ncbi:MAG: hypothetical protein WAW79_01475 [Steroidobacteraceae bacterium]
MPSSWNRSRATAIAATLLLHLLLAAWFLSLKPGTPPVELGIAEFDWAPPSEMPPPLQLMPSLAEPAQVPMMPLPMPEPTMPPPVQYDWYGDGRAVAGALERSAGRRGFGAAPGNSGRKLKSGRDGPPPLFEQPLPRVGSSVRTPEGETILWVSDYCYISLDSMSLTMKDFHDARRGIRTCIVPIGRRTPRTDLFDHLEKPPTGQPPLPRPGPQ